MNIGISQRVDLIRNERRDSLDQNWFTILKSFDLEIFPFQTYCLIQSTG